MHFQDRASRLSHIGKKQIAPHHNSQLQFERTNFIRPKKIKIATEPLQIFSQDSLRAFQQQLRGAILSQSEHKNKNFRKKVSKKFQHSNFNNEEQKSRLIQHSSRQIINLKEEIHQIRGLLKAQNQKKSTEQTLQKILIQLEQQNERQRLVTRTERQLSDIKQRSHFIPQTPMVMPQPQIIFTPQPYYYPMPPPDRNPYRKESKRYRSNSEESQDDILYPQASTRTKNYRTRHANFTVTKNRTSKYKKQRRSKFRVIAFAIMYVFWIKRQAIKLAKARKQSINNYWRNSFQADAKKIKNWLLQSQKMCIPIILQKKNLNFIYFDQKSQRIREQKQKLLTQIVYIGINQLQQFTTSQNIKPFLNCLNKICKNRSFAVNSLWTQRQLQIINFSQAYGFMRLDEFGEKYLIGLLVIVKILIFNLLIQPFKFDTKNFPKKQEPLATNMRLIGSLYYVMVKQVIDQYREETQKDKKVRQRNDVKYKEAGIEVSNPLTYEHCDVRPNQYISGLVREQFFAGLKNNEFWVGCTSKIKNVIQKLHSQMRAY